MIVLGISEGYHDAGVSVINDTEIVSASHSERYSRVKNDKWVCPIQLVPSDKVETFLLEYSDSSFIFSSFKIIGSIPFLKQLL